MRILVAVDGSESSNNALKQTLAFVKQAGGEVIAITVPFYYGAEFELGLVGTTEEVFTGPAEVVLAEARETAKEMGVEIMTVMETGIVHQAIVKTATANDVDLIVMGRRGLTRFERVLMGSVTSRVIGYSPIDVLVMPREGVLKLDKILVPVDGSKYGDAAMERAIKLAAKFNSELHITTVVDINPEAYALYPNIAEQLEEGARSMLSDALKMVEKAQLKADTSMHEGDAHERIIHMAQEFGADMICMGSHGRTGLSRLLMGSVTERVIGESKVPVLVVKTE